MKISKMVIIIGLATILFSGVYANIFQNMFQNENDKISTPPEPCTVTHVSTKSSFQGQFVTTNGMTSCERGKVKVVFYCGESFVGAQTGEINDGIFSVSYSGLTKCKHPIAKVTAKSIDEIMYNALRKK
ncbi:hypothetical protein [Sulfurovum sp.]|uniref:hypothetical protein n=1 Tax=Sulfurovum sp. TaxID=1969726 RepID=UPI00356B0BEF